MGRPLSELVESGWAQALSPVQDNIPAIGEFLRGEVAACRAGHSWGGT